MAAPGLMVPSFGQFGVILYGLACVVVVLLVTGLTADRQSGAFEPTHERASTDFKRARAHARRPRGSGGCRGADAVVAPSSRIGAPDATGLPHPRSFGNHARVIARYVRERGTLTLEDAVRKMTSWPATRMRLADRGVIREGMWADVTNFDLEALDDRATYDSFAAAWERGSALTLAEALRPLRE